MKKGIFIVLILALCIPFAAHAVAPGHEGYNIHVYSTTCQDPSSTTASGSNVDARRAPQNCWAQIKGGGVMYISLVVDNSINLAPIYVLDSVSLNFMHLWNTTYSMFTDLVMDYSAGNWASWTETVDGSGVTHGYLFMTNMGTSSPTNNCTWTIAPNTTAAPPNGIKFTKGSEQFSVWTLDEQDIPFTHNYATSGAC